VNDLAAELTTQGSAHTTQKPSLLTCGSDSPRQNGNVGAVS
jgi:hypothetical protein